MQGLVPFNRAPLWKNFPNHERKEPQRSPPDKKSQVEAAERCVERISIPGAPGLRVIARSSDLTFDMTFDGSPESFARAPLNMMKLDEVYKSLVENPSNHGMNEDHLNVVKQLILEKQENIVKNNVTTTRKQRNTCRHDQYDEATAAAMARLLEAREKRKRRRERTTQLKTNATLGSRTTRMIFNFSRHCVNAWKTPVRSRKRLHELNS